VSPGLEGALIGALAGAALAGALAWRLRRQAAERLERLARQAGRVSESSFAQRLAAPDDPDLEPLTQSINRLADEAGRRLSELSGERDHLQVILESMSDGVLETDSRGRIVLANSAFLALFGVEGEFLGRSVAELTRLPEMGGLVESTLGGEEVSDREITLAGGRVVSLSGMPSGAGGALVVARNVTDRVRLDATRRDFVANISHELKTPLTAIRGYAETLHEGALEDPAVAGKFTSRILDQCRRLEALLADLLALSRLESARVTSSENRVPVEIEGLVRRALETVGGAAAERDVRLDLTVSSPLPVFPGHPEALERLLLNLLENAIKYNRPSGWVRVDLGAAEGELVLAVTDSGIGIPKDALARVFERFYRVDKGRARDEGGTGLGLALVKHAAMVHGGRVEVESRLGEGSSFRVVLPV
jgi:two-component system, OmpR family, phosphate regulon sensor histidine kinase PhoR